MQARRVLAPLLLNLGEHEEAEALLKRWEVEDRSATLLCARLLLALAQWDGEDASEAACHAAFDAAFAQNWHAVLLLGVAISHRVLMASGILLLLAAVSAYYYWLDISLLHKAALLCVLGFALLALRWGLQRWRLATTKGGEHHGR